MTSAAHKDIPIQCEEFRECLGMGELPSFYRIYSVYSIQCSIENTVYSIV